VPSTVVKDTGPDSSNDNVAACDDIDTKVKPNATKTFFIINPNSSLKKELP
jgi:hypothetical protein